MYNFLSYTKEYLTILKILKKACLKLFYGKYYNNSLGEKSNFRR